MGEFGLSLTSREIEMLLSEPKYLGAGRARQAILRIEVKQGRAICESLVKAISGKLRQAALN